MIGAEEQTKSVTQLEHDLVPVVKVPPLTGHKIGDIFSSVSICQSSAGALPRRSALTCVLRLLGFRKADEGLRGERDLQVPRSHGVGNTQRREIR